MLWIQLLCNPDALQPVSLGGGGTGGPEFSQGGGPPWPPLRTAPGSRSSKVIDLGVHGNRGVRQLIFRPNSLPFQWLHSHSYPIPIPIWNINPIPIFPHRAIPYSLPFPFVKSTDTGCLGRIFLQAACCITLLSTNSVRHIKERKRTDEKMN